MSTTLTAPAETAFDADAYIKARNEGKVANVAEHLAEKAAATENVDAAKEAEAKAAADLAVAEAAKAEEAKTEAETTASQLKKDHPGMSDRDRRRLAQSIREAAEAKGRADAAEARAAALELLIRERLDNPARTETRTEPVEASGEPKRDDFKTESEYLVAVARHAGRAEARSEIEALTAQERLNEQLRSAREAQESQINEGLIEDWADIQKRAESLEIDANETNLRMLYAQSELRAFMTEYFVDHSADWEKLRGLDPNKGKTQAEKSDLLVKQTALWNKIEGKVENAVESRREALKSKAKEPTAAEIAAKKEQEKATADAEKARKEQEAAEEKKRKIIEADAAKARPSEAISPKGGSPSDGSIPMMLEDGKTLNPAWVADRNAKSGRRA